MVESLLNPVDAQYVLKIRPSIMHDKTNEITWSYSKNGEYSVKTGYQSTKANINCRNAGTTTTKHHSRES